MLEERRGRKIERIIMGEGYNDQNSLFTDMKLSGEKTNSSHNFLKAYNKLLGEEPEGTSVETSKAMNAVCPSFDG